MISIDHDSGTHVEPWPESSKELIVSDGYRAPKIIVERKPRQVYPLYKPKFVDKRRPVDNRQRKSCMRNTIRSFRRRQ